MSSHEETIIFSTNAKWPPSYDGRVCYEDLVRDGTTLTVIEPDTLLKNRLVEDAARYRELLDNEKLLDPENGVEYFLNFLRGYFLKGTQNVLIYRSSPR